jgi:hypothetical protein
MTAAEHTYLEELVKKEEVIKVKDRVTSGGTGVMKIFQEASGGRNSKPR